ncbi:MAG: NrdH-redoxin [Flavobacteriales bacterium]|nr:NrdH-redoxin [Flavobacteriales bacterium]|tara:strand:- start:58 stop:291 length:234 start_codon:yes stop_codon:yes gene_type:complete
MKNIIIYGADWCRDCMILKEFLEDHNIDYEYIIITDNDEAISFVEKINNGKRVIPTVKIKDKVYANPGINKILSLIV